MANKKALEARIEALEAEIAQLRLQVAQKQPGITIPPYYVPNDWYPYGWPKIWCGNISGTSSGPGSITLNAVA